MVTDDRYPLRVRLDRKGETLQRRAFPAYGAEMALPAQPWSDIGGSYTAGKRTGLAALDRVLDDGSDRKLEQHLSGAALRAAGEVLFEAVFGPEESGWAPCFKRLFGEERALPL